MTMHSKVCTCGKTFQTADPKRVQCPTCQPPPQVQVMSESHNR
jgi:hypothetical protein